MPDVDVLVVGAGPTGLTLAASLHAHGARPRLIDRQADRVHESRALAMQPRSLEVLATFGLAETLVARGNPTARLSMHAGRRTAAIPLFDLGMDDTAYPFLLFISQAVTEQVLGEHLAARGVAVERQVELIDLAPGADAVTCTLRHRDGTVERLTAGYVVGCDGAHSTVRERAGIRFVGGSYPQTFALADLSVDGLPPDTAHSFFGAAGILLFFPLGDPAPWRMISMRPAEGWPGASATDGTRLADLQAVTDRFAGGGRLRLRDAVWLTDFRLQHRYAARYRTGRVFVAGDAAHVHSPAGAQGMNTGIQDAVNLGWKLALAARGLAAPELLDTYDAERRPVGRAVVRFTGRAFAVATSTAPLPRFMRQHVVPRLAPLAARLPRARAYGFRTVAELDIDHRGSPAATEGHPRLRGGPRAGDRLPDGPASVDASQVRLHEVIAGPGFHLLLYGGAATWDRPDIEQLATAYVGLLTVRHVAAAPRLAPRRPEQPAHYLVRPDGHVAYRAAGTDLTGLARYLARWLRDGRR